jgi:hypothetical protein
MNMCNQGQLIIYQSAYIREFHKNCYIKISALPPVVAMFNKEIQVQNYAMNDITTDNFNIFWMKSSKLYFKN